MANEPERPVEQALRAYAIRRRQELGQPPTMPSAMKQRLLREVAHRFAPAGAPHFLTRLLSGFWPRFALGTALATMVISAALWYRPAPVGKRAPSSTLAKNDATRPPASAPLQTLRPTSPAPPTDADAGVLATARSAPGHSKEASAWTGIDREQLAQNQDVRPRQAPLLRQAATANTLDFAAASTGPSSAASDNAIARRYDLFGGPQPAPNPSPAAAPPPSSSTALVNRAAPPPVTTEAATASTPALAAADTSDSLISNSSRGALGSYAVSPGNHSTSGSVQRFTRPQQPKTRSLLTFFHRTNPGGGILSTFQVEQTGRRIRVIDHDGSIYQGWLQSGPEGGLTGARGIPNASGPMAAGQRRSSWSNEPQTQTRAELAIAVARSLTAAAPARPSAPQQLYFFRVSGTNRTLSQPVVFSGSFLPLTDANSLSSTNLAHSLEDAFDLVNVPGPTSGVSESTPPSPQPPLRASEISGKATIGKDKEIEVRAAPSSSNP